MPLTKPQMDGVVLEYAQHSAIFVSPGSILDNINPAPSTMTANQRGQFINELAAFLNARHIDTQVLASDMQASSIWDDVSLSLFGHQ